MTLCHLALRGLAATESNPRDRRPWVAPQIAAPLTFKDYRTNIDPAMQAILKYVPQPPLAGFVKRAAQRKVSA